MKVINDSMNYVVGIILGIVAVTILLSAGPSLIAGLITTITGSYVSNTSGCFIGTPPVSVETFYCTAFDMLPLIVVALFFVVVVGFVIATLKHKGYLK